MLLLSFGGVVIIPLVNLFTLFLPRLLVRRAIGWPHAGTGMLPLLSILAMAMFAFYTSLGGQKVLEGKLLEE
jgi:hypothetical protein